LVPSGDAQLSFNWKNISGRRGGEAYLKPKTIKYKPKREIKKLLRRLSLGSIQKKKTIFALREICKLTRFDSTDVIETVGLIYSSIIEVEEAIDKAKSDYDKC